MSFSSSGYGYDEFNTEISYEDEKNYTKPIKKPSFEERVNAKKNALNGRGAVNRLSKEVECDCIECAPELYKKVKDTKVPESPKDLDLPKDQDKKDNMFYIGFDKDTIFMLFIILLCVLSVMMYFKIKKLSHKLKSLKTVRSQGLAV